MKFPYKTCLLVVIWIIPYLALADSISISGNPGTMTINSATAGQQPSSVTNSSTTYTISTLLTVRSVLGNINANMPASVTLKVGLAAPSGATSLGNVTMSSTAVNLVTGVPAGTSGSSKAITYTFSATVTASQVSANTKVLTLTVQ